MPDKLVNATTPQSAHFYWPDGKPCYELPCKSKPGQMRQPTVKDMPKLGIKPSVTGILKVWAVPGLEAWKQEQAILAALTLPRKDSESDKDFAARVVEDARAEGLAAASKGAAIHDALAAFMLSSAMPEDPICREAVLAFKPWYSEMPEDVGIESSFACPAGYGGRIDLASVGGAGIVVDFKTKDTEPGKKVIGYDEWPLQLAAYADGLNMPPGVRLLNLVFSRNEPGRMEEIDWTDRRAEFSEGWRICLASWKWQHRRWVNKEG